jgi:hypothetical protein
MTIPTIASGTDRSESLIALAERCEKATGPNRELDWAIHVAIHPDKVTVKRSHHYLYDEQYTASLDAAMTLVPEVWEPWDLNKGQRWHFSLKRQGGKYPIVDGHADTWPLAICAAALRARAAQ